MWTNLRFTPEEAAAGAGPLGPLLPRVYSRELAVETMTVCLKPSSSPPAKCAARFPIPSPLVTSPPFDSLLPPCSPPVLPIRHAADEGNGGQESQRQAG
jgi:hypothetical protein